MHYVEGFVTAVPAANRQAYRDHAASAAPLLKEYGVTRLVECRGDDVPEGKVTDFRGAVQATADEDVVFSWFEYPSKAIRDAANDRMRDDPRMRELGAAAPFDAGRMIFGGFVPILDEGAGGPFGYADGFLLAVPAANRAVYRDMAARVAPVMREYGATRVVEGWGDDVPAGKRTDFRRAVRAGDGEVVVYSWVEWPSKAVRMAGWGKMMADPRVQPGPDGMPFDRQRAIFGGFAPLLDA